MTEPQWTETPCRFCGGAIIWSVTDKGKMMPVDAKRSPDGSIKLWMDGNGATRSAVVTPAKLRFGRELYLSHFATCPHASKARRR